MSGLVNGLQNRLRRFESATHLRRGIHYLSDEWGPLLFTKDARLNSFSFPIFILTDIIRA